MPIDRFAGIVDIPQEIWHGSLVASHPGFRLRYVDRYRGPRTDRSATSHPHWELICVIGGRGRLDADRELALAPGAAVLLRPGVAHREAAAGMLDTVWIGFEGGRLPACGPASASVHDAALVGQAEELWVRRQSAAPGDGPEIEGLALGLLGRFSRLDAGRSAVGADVIGAIVRWLDAHLDQEIDVAGLAVRFRISQSHLHRCFKERTGTSPNAFLTRLRLERARRLLLHTDLPVTRIAALVGFRDPLYFSRVARRAWAMPPSLLRARGER